MKKILKGTFLITALLIGSLLVSQIAFTQTVYGLDDEPAPEKVPDATPCTN